MNRRHMIDDHHGPSAGRANLLFRAVDGILGTHSNSAGQSRGRDSRHAQVPDPAVYGITGYLVLMVLVQLRLLPIYGRLKFTPGFWAFTFPSAVIAGFALTWLHIERPAGQAAYSVLVLAAVSLLIGAITARSLIAIARGQFLPGPGNLN